MTDNVENAKIARKILRIGPLEEIDYTIGGTIGDLCTEMYHRVDRGKPIASGE